MLSYSANRWCFGIIWAVGLYDSGTHYELYILLEKIPFIVAVELLTILDVKIITQQNNCHMRLSS